MEGAGGARPCEICGDEVPAGRSACPSCGRLQSGGRGTEGDLGPSGAIDASVGSASNRPTSAASSSAAPAPPPPSPTTRPTAAYGLLDPEPVERPRAGVKLWAVLVAIGVVAAIAGLGLLGGSVLSDRRDERDLAMRERPPTDEADWARRYEDFCRTERPSPGIDPFVPGEAAQAWVDIDDTDVSYGRPRPFAITISPELGEVRRDGSRAELTRVVVCTEFVERTDGWEGCPYSVGLTGGAILLVQRGIYEIRAHDLHDGSILAEGLVASRDRGCPPDILVGQDPEWALDDDAIVSWIRSSLGPA